MDKLLVVPVWWFSPRALDAIPANLATLDELRAHFDVDLFVWPCVRGGEPVEPTWQAVVEALVGRIDRRTHLLALGVPAVGAVAAARGSPRSLINSGVYMPAATLRALGRHDIADYTQRPFPARSYFFVRQVLKGASEESVRRVSSIIDAEVDWELARRVYESYHTLDLVAERALVTVPALYLATPAEEFSRRAADGFRRLAPNLRVRQLRRWPDRMDEEETGRELARHVVDFVSELPDA